MVTVPPPAPLVTNPVKGSIDAIEELLLLHVPPGVASNSVAVSGKHTVEMPETGVIGFTVTISVELSLTQPGPVVWVT